jgi:hypothetical protein
MSSTSTFNDILSFSIIVIVGMFILYYSYTSYKSFAQPKKNDPRPYPKCPDYWESVGNGKCRNVHKIGNCRLKPSEDTVDFSGEVFQNNKSGDYMRCKWAKECHAPWEGIDDLCT